MQKECDARQRFSLRKLSVGLASVLVGVSFMAINLGQTVHADELQTPSQPDHVIQKANNLTNDVVNDNEQNQAKSDTAQTINHVDPNNNLQQNADKNEAEASATTATNAIVDRQANVAATSNKNAWGGYC